MGMFDVFKKQGEKQVKPTQETVNKAVSDGGVSVEQSKIEQQKEVEERTSKWTPKQKAAFDFLRTRGFIKNVDIENLTKNIVDYVENFEKHPKEVVPSSKFDEKTGKWDATGKYSLGLKQ